MLKTEVLQSLTVNHISQIFLICKFQKSWDSVLAAINTFQNHRSVANTKQREFNSVFIFKNTNGNEVCKIIKNLNVC